MSATLTFALSGLTTKTGTTAGALFADLKTLIDSHSGDSAFSWIIAGSSLAATPYWLVLKRKDASVGRILLVLWTSAPAGNNAAILDQAPVTNQLFIAWFPAGNADAASNLTAASGTVLGDDANVVKVAPGPTLTSGYGVDVHAFYADAAEGLVFGFQNPAPSSPLYAVGAGALVVDGADVAYPCTIGSAVFSLGAFGATSAFPLGWLSSAQLAGAGGAGVIRAHYGANNAAFFQAFAPSGVWASQAVGSGDVLTDTALNRVWFVPCFLLGQVKGQGIQLKLRQIALGPGTTGPFAIYQTTGPVTVATQLCAATAGGNGYPWLLNAKI
jgi:hypothetical protein